MVLNLLPCTVNTVHSGAQRSHPRALGPSRTWGSNAAELLGKGTTEGFSHAVSEQVVNSSDISYLRTTACHQGAGSNTAVNRWHLLH